MARTIRILTKKTIQFKLGYEYGKPEKDKMQWTSKGGMCIEDAPDWIINDPYFDLCRADGDIEVFANVDIKPLPNKKKVIKNNG